MDEDKSKITWCQLLIGATGSSILSGLEDDASWETAKETLLSRLGIGSVKDEAWATLKHLKKGSKEIVELAGEAKKLTKRLHPRDEEAAERHVIDAFLGALERPLAAEVQKLGCHTMEDVVAVARRIEKVLEEQNDSKMEQLITSMQDQIRILTKDLKSAREQMAAQQASATPTAALAAPPIATVAAAHPPPLTQPPSLVAGQPLSHHHTLLDATCIRITRMRDHIFGHHAANRTEGLPAASYAAKRAILSLTAPLAPSSSSYCSNKRGIPLAMPQEDKSWSCLQ